MQQLTLTEAAPDSLIRTLVRWGLYPASWALLIFGFWRIIATDADPRPVWMQTSGVLFATYFVTEFFLPYQARWSMTLRSFWADFKFIVVNSGVIAGITAALALATITLAGRNDGPASDWPLLAQVGASLTVFEAINYALHRAMHEMRGPLGRFLWHSHAAHHLPPRLYLLMHAVFHPVNAVLIQGLAIILPIWLAGYTPEAVAIFLMINGMSGLISHFNVDIRAGWLNYIFVGTELHRYHHSADVNEARNYGATLSVFDWLFGTFVYHPGVPPQELGVDAASGLPAYERTFTVLALPFRAASDHALDA